MRERVSFCSIILATSVAASAGADVVRFEENRGQADQEVQYLAAGRTSTLFLTASEMVLAIPASGTRAEAAVLRLRLLGADPAATARGGGRLSGAVNRYAGSDPRRWRSGIPLYASVEVPGAYPGVDLVVHGRTGRLEYDFVALPGSDPGAIALAVDGACAVELAADGALLLRTEGPVVRQEVPVAYQHLAGGTLRHVPVRYVLGDGGVVRFALGEYDRGLPLVIDPVISYSTYLGGSGDDTLAAMAVDAAGSVYATGTTSSIDFPVRGGLQPALAGPEDVFVTRLDPTGTAIVYSTYLGGADLDRGAGIAVDAAGNAYVTGWTESPDFPVKDAFQATMAGGEDAIVFKLDPAGALAYSTYLGGSFWAFPGFQDPMDRGRTIAADAAGNAYVAGITQSYDFPTKDPFKTQPGQPIEGFVTKIDPTGSALVFSSFLGGTNFDGNAFGDFPNAIAFDGAGAAYVAGFTDSWSGFPLQDAFQGTMNGPSDGFVTKVAPDGSLAYSTYLGGDGGDGADGIAVDAAGNAYVTGGTFGAAFPLRDPYQSTTDGADAFVTKFDPTGTLLLYSTYLGGTTGASPSRGSDTGRRIAVDGAGNAYVTGRTESVDFPTKDAVQAASAGDWDAFVTVLNPAGSDLVFSTYLGGSGEEFPQPRSPSLPDLAAVAVDSLGRVYVAGTTDSLDFPLRGPLDPTIAGLEGFITRICLAAEAAPPPVGNTLTVVEVGTSDMLAQWTDVSGATSYNLYGDVAKDGSFPTAFGSAPSGTTGLARPIPAEPLLFLRVAAATACAESAK